MELIELIENEDKFEQFVVTVASHILGEGITGFAKGKDGGRDARFHNKTNHYPSTEECWEPKNGEAVIIQAKFTHDWSKTTGTGDFRKLIQEEIPKLCKLRKSGELRYYILVTNRKLTANSHSSLLMLLSEGIGLSQNDIQIWGRETLVRFWDDNHQIREKSNLIELARRKFHLIDDSLIAKVVRTISKNLNDESVSDIIDRTTLAQKNILNNASDEFADFMISQYADEFSRITDLLSNPEYYELRKNYTSLVKHISLQLYHNRKLFCCLDDNLYNIIENEVRSDTVFEQGDLKVVLQILVHYMYWNCDVGKRINDKY